MEDALSDWRDEGGKNNIFDLLWQSLIPYSFSCVFVCLVAPLFLACALRILTLEGCLQEIFLHTHQKRKKKFPFYRRNQRDPRDVLAVLDCLSRLIPPMTGHHVTSSAKKHLETQTDRKCMAKIKS